MLIIQRYSVKITKIILLKHTVTLLRLGGYFEWRPWPHHEDLNTKIVNNPRSRAIGLNASRDCKCREPYRIKILLKVPSRREIRACHYCIVRKNVFFHLKSRHPFLTSKCARMFVLGNYPYLKVRSLQGEACIIRSLFRMDNIRRLMCERIFASNWSYWS